MTTALNGNGRPFTYKVKELRRRGMRYADLESGCDRARSTAWFNNLVNGSGPWAVAPPDRSTFPKLAKLFKTDEESVRKMIAEEWFRVVPTPLSRRVRTLESRIDLLSDDDFALVESLIQRFLAAPSDDADEPGTEPNGSARTSPSDVVPSDLPA